MEGVGRLLASLLLLALSGVHVVVLNARRTGTAMSMGVQEVEQMHGAAESSRTRTRGCKRSSVSLCC